MSVSYEPLHNPETDPPTVPLPVDDALKSARADLDRYAGSNIHDHTAMLQAAVAFDYRLRSLMAAVEAERGEGR